MLCSSLSLWAISYHTLILLFFISHRVCRSENALINTKPEFNSHSACSSFSLFSMWKGQIELGYDMTRLVIFVNHYCQDFLPFLSQFQAKSLISHFATPFLFQCIVFIIYISVHSLLFQKGFHVLCRSMHFSTAIHVIQKSLYSKQNCHFSNFFSFEALEMANLHKF